VSPERTNRIDRSRAGADVDCSARDALRAARIDGAVYEAFRNDAAPDGIRCKATVTNCIEDRQALAVTSTREEGKRSSRFRLKDRIWQ